MAVRSSSMPWPGPRRDEHRARVRRQQPRRPPPRRRRRPVPRASALLTTSSSGSASAPISASTARTASIWPSRSGAEPSTTWTIRSDSSTTSRVERNASTTWWGSLRTKPTVSVSSTVSPPGQVEPAGPRVEGGEQPVLDEDVGLAQPVEQRRLAGVGVADQGHRALATALAPPPLDPAGPVELAQVGLEPAHPLHQSPAVDLELGLAGAPGADATGLLAERVAPAPQPGQPVAQQGQLHLGPALGGAGVLGEDVEDHRGAVDGGPARGSSPGCAAGRARGRRRTPPCRRRPPGTARSSSSALPRPR